MSYIPSLHAYRVISLKGHWQILLIQIRLSPPLHSLIHLQSFTKYANDLSSIYLLLIYLLFSLTHTLSPLLHNNLSYLSGLFPQNARIKSSISFRWQHTFSCNLCFRYYQSSLWDRVYSYLLNYNPFFDLWNTEHWCFDWRPLLSSQQNILLEMVYISRLKSVY